MRMLPFVLLVACGHTAPSPPTAATPPGAAQVDGAFEPLRGLLGKWEGADPDRHSRGGFTLRPDLGGRVLVRRSWNDGPQGHHEDLMIIFASPAGLRASYFDNEAHAINYSIVASKDRVELLSDEVANQPRFRLRYDRRGTGDLAIDFAIAMPGAGEFKHYTGGTVHRVRQ